MAAGAECGHKVGGQKVGGQGRRQEVAAAARQGMRRVAAGSGTVRAARRQLGGGASWGEPSRGWEISGRYGEGAAAASCGFGSNQALSSSAPHRQFRAGLGSELRLGLSSGPS